MSYVLETHLHITHHLELDLKQQPLRRVEKMLTSHHRNNTYGVKGLPDDIYVQTLNDFYRAGGCQEQIFACTNQTVEEREANPAICRNATSFCRNNVEGPYYDYSGRGVYGRQRRTTLLIDFYSIMNPRRT